MMNLQLSVTRNAPSVSADKWDWRRDCECDGEVPAGAIVEYRAHTIGGMVKVRHDGRDVIIHPANTKELS